MTASHNLPPLQHLSDSLSQHQCIITTKIDMRLIQKYYRVIYCVVYYFIAIA